MTAGTQDLTGLLARMTLPQKVAQLYGVTVYDLLDLTPLEEGAPLAMRYDLSRLPEVRPDGVGHASLTWLLDPELDSFAARLEELQEHVRSVSPFGIGALVHGEGINGFLHSQGYQFPTAWGQAATWQPELLEQVGRTVGAQMERTGVHLAFSPVLDLSRDLRWGRVHETYGEDAELVSRLGVSFVRGIHQGDADDAAVLATAKHFVGYGASEGGLNQATSRLGRRALRDVYAEPFRRAIAEAGLSLVMNSYNTIDGVPAAADRWLLTDLLRGELGFRGLVVSDYDSIGMLLKTYHTVSTAGAAASAALRAGLDVELPSNETFTGLVEEVESGRLAEQVVDQAVLRVLEVKDRLGLVPPVRPRSRRAAPPVPAEAAEALSRQIAAQAMVLLKNDGLLPLAADTPRLAVVGSAADEIRIHFGAYTSVSNEELPLAIGKIFAGEIPGIDPATMIFPDLFQTRLPGIDPAFEEQARRLHPTTLTVADAVRSVNPDAVLCTLGTPDLEAPPLDEERLADELRDVDTVVALVGERTSWVGNHTAGEGRTTAFATLPGNQIELVRALSLLGKRIVLVLVSGRPLVLSEEVALCEAVLLAPLLGPCAGEAIADAVFGRTAPGGALPSTFPRTIGQVPMYSGHEIGSGYEHPTGTRHGYVDLPDSSPLFPFGHGLSYTTFEVSGATADIGMDASGQRVVRVSADVANIGDAAGSTVVQLYARDEVATVVRPARQLLAFARVAPLPGERAHVDLEAPLARLAYSLPDGRCLLEAGEIALLLGLSSADIRWQATVDVPEVTVGSATTP